jgi:hypothetical protein
VRIYTSKKYSQIKVWKSPETPLSLYLLLWLLASKIELILCSWIIPQFTVHAPLSFRAFPN